MIKSINYSIYFIKQEVENLTYVIISKDIFLILDNENPYLSFNKINSYRFDPNISSKKPNFLSTSKILLLSSTIRFKY